MRPRSALLPYQEKAAAWIVSNPRCGLLLDPGLGKTASTLTAYADLRASFDTRRMLVIGPKRVVRKGWSDQIGEWEHLQGVSTAIAVGDSKTRWDALRVPADIHLINRDCISWLYAQFVAHGKQFRRWPWDMVVVDEAHSVRNQSGIRWKQLNALSVLFPRMVLLTGTFTPNGLRNAWAPTYLLDKGRRLGPTEDGYLSRYFTEPSHEYGKWRPKAGADEEIRDKIADLYFTLRTEDVLSLPPVVLNVVPVELPPKALRQYKELKSKFITEVGGDKVRAANSAAVQAKLLQIANGAIYTEEGKWVELHSEKLDAMDDLLDALEGKQVLIVYAFRHDKARILERLKRSRPHAIARVYDTDEDENAWNAGEIDYLLVHPDSAGEGTNLHKSGAENVLWFGGTNNLLSWVQTNDRLFGGQRRLGKAGRVHVLLAEKTIDEAYRALIESKNLEQEDFKAKLAAATLVE